EGPLVSRFKEEYFPVEGWDALVRAAVFPAGMHAQERREAHRALKGSLLRQEVYATDGSEREGIPYSVKAIAYRVQQIQPLPAAPSGGLPPTPSEGGGAPAHAVFLNLQEQSVVFSCERNNEDP